MSRVLTVETIVRALVGSLLLAHVVGCAREIRKRGFREWARQGWGKSYVQYVAALSRDRLSWLLALWAAFFGLTIGALLLF